VPIWRALGRWTFRKPKCGREVVLTTGGEPIYNFDLRKNKPSSVIQLPHQVRGAHDLERFAPLRAGLRDFCRRGNSALDDIREGKIKALAITRPQRSPDLPDVPTMKELGLDELTLEFWAGMWAPAGVPADVVEKLNAAVNEALQSSEMIASMKKLGFESRISSSQDFAAFVAAEIRRWTAVVKASGVKSQ